MRDALRWIETCYLNYIRSQRECQLVHEQFLTFPVKLMDVILGIVSVHILVKTIMPVSRCWHVAYFLYRYIAWNELPNWVADKNVSTFNFVPQPVPNISSGVIFLVNKICPDLDMTAE